ncbi:hypothetical protein M422DRAFT_152482 [Sphaerobolus stellatus SS14]|nr:hypothetical protein M422DRAFT_152482 [Sphaerobolus stellatus SS14]
MRRRQRGSYTDSQSSASGPSGPRSSLSAGVSSPRDSVSRGTHSSARSRQSDGPLMTMRFEHVQQEDGEHHVIIGREGKLTQCEDEPIRVPGAVQGFGVLVALKQEEDVLSVRQVSENCTELLGFSPRYIFSLECFTYTLPDSQADILWDNVQFLNDPDNEELEGPIEGPQVFLLSGYGEPGSAAIDPDAPPSSRNTDRRVWTCWCAAHRSPSGLVILEFELERDMFNPLYPPYQSESGGSGSSSRGSGGSGETSEGMTAMNSSSGGTSTTSLTPGSEQQTPLGETPFPEVMIASPKGLAGDEDWYPSPEDILESTTSFSRPLRALERMRRMSRMPGGGIESTKSGKRRRSARGAGIGTMDVFSVLAQVNDQFAAAPDLEAFLKVVVGVIKDLCQFHRVLVYQFDESWNGQVVAELVDWNQTHDLYKNLHFPASDIPAQARELYRLNKVRLLYNRSQPTARLVVKTKDDLEPPLDMTHGYLRAMSPIHVKYLGNMGVRASMSISIIAFGQLWGLIACHSYGDHGMRVSFPVRQMLRLLSDSISRNVERLSYAQRLHTRKLISTLPTDSHPTGYIVSNAEDLLSLFDADFGVLVVGEGAKILGANQHGQEILILAEYLRLKQFEMLQVSQAVTVDYPDLVLPTGLEVIAGLLYVPLSSGGKDFIALLRKGQMRDVHWAGRPHKDTGPGVNLEPRKSFKLWSERIVGRCRAWTDEQLETAGVLALVYGKFIEVWRQKESALQTTQLTNLLLSNASHEVRTPLNHIINYLELALNGPLDGETRENLRRSHTASKACRFPRGSLLFTINDLLDLTRLESGNETSFNEPFDLHATVDEAVHLYRIEANRRGLAFEVNNTDSPRFVVGDAKKIRTVLGNLVANAIKYTSEGKISVESRKYPEPQGLRNSQQIAVEIIVSDTGCGMSEAKLESMFREFEQVESAAPRPPGQPGLGLGLAVVARIIEQLGGQLRVDSKSGKGSTFSFLIPFGLYDPSQDSRTHSVGSSFTTGSQDSRQRSDMSIVSEIDGLVQVLSNAQLSSKPPSTSNQSHQSHPSLTQVPRPKERPQAGPSSDNVKLRVMVVDDDPINRTILRKRLVLDGHEVLATTNGQEVVRAVEADRAFDCVLMDIQMPILDGFEATKAIRELEKNSSPRTTESEAMRLSLRLNGRIPIFAVSASLVEHQREAMSNLGLDGWILKPIDFKRLSTILHGITNMAERRDCLYHPGCNWEAGGWLQAPGMPLPTQP